MAIEGDMVAALVANASVAALVVARIYPHTAPQGATLPHIVYVRTSYEPIQASTGPTGTVNASYAFTSRAATYAGAKTLATAVRAVLGTWTNTSGTPSVSSCRCVSEEEDTEYRSDDSEELVNVVTQDYSLWYA